MQWISETGSAGGVSNVIVSPIGANNLTPGPVQSEVIAQSCAFLA